MARSRTTGSFSSGGGVYARGGPLIMRSVRLIDNAAPRAGGGLAVFEPDASLEDVVVRDNETGPAEGQDPALNPGYGGGMYLYGAGGAQLSRVHLIDNTAAGPGGGLATLGGGGFVVSDSRVLGNRSRVDGGGLWASAWETIVHRSLLAANRAARNGAARPAVSSETRW